MKKREMIKKLARFIKKQYLQSGDAIDKRGDRVEVSLIDAEKFFDSLNKTTSQTRKSYEKS